MNISSHLLIDAGILSAALTITLVLRARGTQLEKSKIVNDYKKKRRQNTETLNYLGFGIF